MADPHAARRGGLSNREVLVAVVVALAAGTLLSLALRPARPIVAADGATAAGRTVRWRVPVAFGTNLPALGDNVLYVSEQTRAASAGRLQLDVYEPGELVPPFAITDAVRDGKVEAGYTWVGYDQGKLPWASLFGAVPFGMEPWEYVAWWYHAGGRELAEELYAEQGIYPLLCGIIGPESAGWFRSEIQTLEKGAIDATEFSMPAIDQRLGFDRIVKFNYFPGWHQPFTAFHLTVNPASWEELTGDQRALLETACTAGITRNLAHGEAIQGAVLRASSAKGVIVSSLPEEVLRELEAVTEQVLAEQAAENDDFRRVLESQRAFSSDYQVWKSTGFLPRDF